MASGRLQCRQCGANNFDSVTACWKCGAPLSGAAPAPAPAARSVGSMPPPAASNPQAPQWQPVVPNAPAGGGYEQQGNRSNFTAPVYAAAAATGNPALSNRAAIWLGLLFPYFGIMVGLAFMMCNDRHRQEVGRTCVIWSIVSTAIHILIFAVSLIGLRDYATLALGIGKGALQRQGGMGSGMGGGLE